MQVPPVEIAVAPARVHITVADFTALKVVEGLEDRVLGW